MGRQVNKLFNILDRKTAAIWSLDCAEHVLPLFEKKYPRDKRPRRAIKVGRAWVRTGVFHMAVIRKASLDAHAAARRSKNEAARAAARAAGQAVAAAHVANHALAATAYAVKAVELASRKGKTSPNLLSIVRGKSTGLSSPAIKEQAWQYRRLQKIGALEK